MSRKPLSLQTKGVSKKRVRSKQVGVATRGARGQDSNRPIHAGVLEGGGGLLSDTILLLYTS